MSSHRKPTRNELEARISRLVRESEKDFKRMCHAEGVIQELTVRVKQLEAELRTARANECKACGQPGQA